MRATSRLVLLLLQGESGCFAQLCALLLLQPAECMLWAGAAAGAVRCQLDALLLVCTGLLLPAVMGPTGWEAAAVWRLPPRRREASCCFQLSPWHGTVQGVRLLVRASSDAMLCTPCAGGREG